MKQAQGFLGYLFNNKSVQENNQGRQSKIIQNLNFFNLEKEATQSQIKEKYGKRIVQCFQNNAETKEILQVNKRFEELIRDCFQIEQIILDSEGLDKQKQNSRTINNQDHKYGFNFIYKCSWFQSDAQKQLKNALQFFQLESSSIQKSAIEWIYLTKKKFYEKHQENKHFVQKLKLLNKYYEILCKKVKQQEKDMIYTQI